jgi:hypothetical protein
VKYRKVTYEEAIKIMAKIREKTDDIGIYTDRGWGMILQ